ncbi:MAG: hypothetical protein L0099_16090 [Acidobacteria bacterium]|nr:hypothetical protein [Acidobacteriota bacterium]
MALMRMQWQSQGVPVRVVPDQPRYVRESVMRTVPFAETLFTRPALRVPRPKRPAPPRETEIHLSPSMARAVFWALRCLHRLASLATVTVPVTYLLYVGFGLGLVRDTLLQGTMLMDYMHALVLPIAYLAEHVLPLRTVIHGFNWWLATAAILAWVLRSLLLSRLERAEAWAKTQAFQANWEEFRGRSKMIQ